MTVWIIASIFPFRLYSPDWMVDALVECITKKTTKYSAEPPGVSEFYLLVHYDKAFFYNTPVQGIDFGYEEVVRAAAAKIGSAVGMFDRIFVYVPVADGKKTFQLYPQKVMAFLMACGLGKGTFRAGRKEDGTR